jgi:hypothetical protein
VDQFHAWLGAKQIVLHLLHFSKPLNVRSRSDHVTASPFSYSDMRVSSWDMSLNMHRMTFGDNLRDSQR